MKRGDSVRVHPHGSPEQARLGKVVLLSSNNRSIAVAFDHMPPWAFRRGEPVGIHPEHGITLLAYRHEVGPWIELVGGGHYEIEEAL